MSKTRPNPAHFIFSQDELLHIQSEETCGKSLPKIKSKLKNLIGPEPSLASKDPFPMLGPPQKSWDDISQVPQHSQLRKKVSLTILSGGKTMKETPKTHLTLTPKSQLNSIEPPAQRKNAINRKGSGLIPLPLRISSPSKSSLFPKPNAPNKPPSPVSFKHDKLLLQPAKKLIWALETIYKQTEEGKEMSSMLPVAEEALKTENILKKMESGASHKLNKALLLLFLLLGYQNNKKSLSRISAYVKNAIFIVKKELSENEMENSEENGNKRQEKAFSLVQQSDILLGQM